MGNIAMSRLFDTITETENTRPTLSIEEIEKALVDNYKNWETLTDRYYAEKISEDSYDRSSEALWDEEENLKEMYRETYPNAFNDETVGDEHIFEIINIYFEQNHIVTPEVILYATAMEGEDTDAEYICKVRSFHNGKFVNNYVHVYMDNDYTGRERVFKEDCDNTCMAIAKAIGHEFVAVIDVKKI